MLELIKQLTGREIGRHTFFQQVQGQHTSPDELSAGVHQTTDAKALSRISIAVRRTLAKTYAGEVEADRSKLLSVSP